MDAAPPPAPAALPGPAPPDPNGPRPSAPARTPTREMPALFAAWPKSAQVTTAFLLGVAVAALALNVLGYLRWGSRPTDLEHGAVPAYRVDLNRADHAALVQLPGVGDSLAKRIEGHRASHGPFRKVDDLVAVKG